MESTLALPCDKISTFSPPKHRTELCSEHLCLVHVIIQCMFMLYSGTIFVSSFVCLFSVIFISFYIFFFSFNLILNCYQPSLNSSETIRN